MNTIIRMIAFVYTMLHMRKSVNTIIPLAEKISDFEKLEQKIE